MKKLIKNYLAKLQENDKKGFSLVELIIVMAIMAILVGVVASQVLPYMEKSRISKDQEALASIQMDISSALAMSGEAAAGEDASVGAKALADLADVTNAATVTEFEDLRGLTSGGLGNYVSNDIKFKSKAAKGAKVYVQIVGGEIAVYLSDDNGSSAVNEKLCVPDGKVKVSTGN